MHVLVKKWDNSPAIKIPAAIMEAANLHLDDSVNIREEAGCIIIQPVQQPEFALADLLAGITDDNVHHAIDFGSPVGQKRL